ncbi:CLUMA_CG002936, isoform A [Clunio marinus]|uniref:CLUMA_CG002936, isoform A n=1 Tax=Clunio marinus TaxID=568069 RepID=A0A1J1HM93_9DIPT|nr:CLUMA_CG002936, isoform A [Clunio marinus]
MRTQWTMFVIIQNLHRHCEKCSVFERFQLYNVSYVPVMILMAPAAVCISAFERANTFNFPEVQQKNIFSVTIFYELLM